MKLRALAAVLTVATVSMLLPAVTGPPQAAGIVAGRVRETFQPNRGRIFVLIIGNDARSGNPDRSRADALHLIGINTKTMRGGILNFPRDSYVNIPGSGSGRINEALYRGGPRLQVRTIESLTGIRIDYWVMTGFVGFRGIMRGIGPVPFRFKKGLYDPGGSGAHIKAGTKRLSSEAALAFVRTRKALPNGDIARTTNQARFLLAMLKKFRSEVDAAPEVLLDWMAVTQRHTRLDLAPEEMFRLGVLASQVSPSKIKSVTLPVTLGTVGAASVVFIRPEAQRIYKRFRKNAAL